MMRLAPRQVVSRPYILLYEMRTKRAVPHDDNT